MFTLVSVELQVQLTSSPCKQPTLVLCSCWLLTLSPVLTLAIRKETIGERAQRKVGSHHFPWTVTAPSLANASGIWVVAEIILVPQCNLARTLDAHTQTDMSILGFDLMQIPGDCNLTSDSPA